MSKKTKTMKSFEELAKEFESVDEVTVEVGEPAPFIVQEHLRPTTTPSSALIESVNTLIDSKWEMLVAALPITFEAATFRASLAAKSTRQRIKTILRALILDMPEEKTNVILSALSMINADKITGDIVRRCIGGDSVSDIMQELIVDSIVPSETGDDAPSTPEDSTPDEVNVSSDPANVLTLKMPKVPDMNHIGIVRALNALKALDATAPTADEPEVASSAPEDSAPATAPEVATPAAPIIRAAAPAAKTGDWTVDMAPFSKEEEAYIADLRVTYPKVGCYTSLRNAFVMRFRRVS